MSEPTKYRKTASFWMADLRLVRRAMPVPGLRRPFPYASWSVTRA